MIIKRLSIPLEIIFWKITVLLLSKSRIFQGLVKGSYQVYEHVRHGLALSKLTVWALVLGLFLGLGIWSGRTARDIAPAAGSTKAFSAKSPAPTPSNGQINYLVIGVDRLTVEEPRLESIWLLAYFPHRPYISLVPLYPYPAGSITQENSKIGTSIPVTPDGKPGPELVKTLRKNNIWWNSYVIADTTAMIEIVDFLGGVEINGQRLNGALAVSSFPPSWEDSFAALTGQTQLLRGMCAQTKLLTPTADLRAIINLIPDHMQTDMDIFAAVRTWRELANDEQEFACDFPLTKASLP